MRLYLLDVGGLAAWQHYAVTDQSPHGDLVEGVRLWWSEFVKRYDPTHVVACFDCSRESNWRKKRYVEYKSARDSKPKDEALAEGLRKLPDVFRALGVPQLRAEGFEADDLIATLSARHDGEVIVVSTDKDMHQLVDDRVQVFDPRPNKAGECIFYDAAKVEEKHHVPPHRLRELLAIMGDSSDSVPGVKGWGKVAAVNAIKETRSRLEIVRKVRAGELTCATKKHQASFAAQMADFELSYELVGLRFDAPIPDDFDTTLKTESEAA